MPKDSATSLKMLNERRKKAMEYRLRGYSYRAIGARIAKDENKPEPFPEATVYGWVSSAMEDARKNYTDKAIEVLEMELARIDRMVQGMEQSLFPPDEVPPTDEELEKDPEKFKAFKAKVDMIFAVNQLLDRKAKLMGFYRESDMKTKEPLPWNDNE